jgi:hypothetical protein
MACVKIGKNALSTSACPEKRGTKEYPSEPLKGPSSPFDIRAEKI